MRPATIALLLVCVAFPAQAASLDGSQIGLVWTLPFLGLLLSIAVLPVLAPRLWCRHHGKVAAAWGAAFLIPFALAFGPVAAVHELGFLLVDEYFPFLALMVALYTAGGGVVLRGRLAGTPAGNTALLAVGAVLASVMGGLAAALLLIRPLLRANAGRRHRVHSVVFFIFLVANIGGSLTPLGHPPLYLGFLAGVPLAWLAQNLLLPVAVCVAALLLVFHLLDSWLHAKEGARPAPVQPGPPVVIQGWVNLFLILVVVGAVVLQAVWQPGGTTLLGEALGIERLVALGIFLAVTAASVLLTAPQLREANDFAWGPMLEVAKLFAAIFLCMAPVLALLKAGPEGALAPLAALTTDAGGAPIAWVFFWLTGGVSAVVDNTPAYLMALNLAGGDVAALLGQGGATLAAISAGAVFMGAMTYLGNPANFMVKAIAEESGVRMPSFLGYLGWACLFLLPLFVLCTFLSFL